MCNHCPYVKAVVDRLIDLQNTLGPRGVQLVGINSNDAARYPDDSPENRITSYNVCYTKLLRMGARMPVHSHTRVSDILAAYPGGK